MRIYTALKNILIIVKWLYETLTDSSTLSDGYIIFPNGLKICWGYFSSKKSGDIITTPISYSYGVHITLPEYSFYESWMAHYSNGLITGNTFTLYPIDITTHQGSTSTRLSGIYFAIGY